jgi:hypothetical protein
LRSTQFKILIAVLQYRFYLAFRTTGVEESSLFLLLLALFLFPIAIYCTVLGMINRRTQPLMVSGSWDFVGVLLATSGFLLFVGPALLSGTFRQSLRDLPFQRDGASLGGAISEMWAAWWVAWLLYYLVVLGGAALLVWTRRDTTVIYNIDPQTFEMVLSRTADRLGLDMERRGHRLYFSAGPGPRSLESSLANQVTADPKLLTPAPPPLVRLPSAPVIVDVESFTMLSNVSLHWRSCSPEARADLERELGTALSEVLTADNPAGTWLLGIAAFLFLLIMLLTAVFVVAVMTVPRR